MTKKKKVIIVLVVSGVVLLFGFLGFLIYTNIKLRMELAETESVQDEDESEEETEDSEEDASTEEDADDSDSETEVEEESDDGDMTDLWNDYSKPFYEFSLKYPKDLTYTEQDDFATGGAFRVAFMAGGVDVFEAKVLKSDPDSDAADVAEMNIVNVCTDTVTHSEYTVNGTIYARATDVPSQTCLDSFGVERTIPLEAFAIKVDMNMFFVLINHGLNEAQLEALMGTVDAH